MVKTMEGVYGDDGIQCFRATNGNNMETVLETIGTEVLVLKYPSVERRRVVRQE